MAEEKKSETVFTPDEVIAKQRNRQLLIMTAIIVVLSGAVWLTSRGATDEAPLQEVMLVGGSREDPAILPIDVRRIQIWKGKSDSPFELSRSGEEWRVPSRFNAPADKAEVDSLLTRITDSARLSRASSTTESQYINYSLNEEDAVHVRLLGEKGNELLQFMIGRSDTGSRDFVRLVGPGKPEGIFELAGLGGTFDTLYSALKLDANGEPKASRWVSKAAFQPLPYEAVAQEITLKDGDNALTFGRKVGSDPAADEWEMTAPRKGDAEGTAVRTIIDTLQNYRANDIAGRDTDAVKLGVAAATREVTLRYSAGKDIQTVHLYFGNSNDAGEVAVWLKTNNKGEFIWWAGDFVLSRIFRGTGEFMRKVRVNLVPDGVTPETLSVEDHGAVLKLVREQTTGGAWKIEQPWAQDAERTEVSNLLTGLATLQGYPASDSVPREELGLGPGISTRVISATYADRKPGERDGDDTPDSTPETPKPETKPVKTATLYFGKTQQGEIPVMRVLDGVEVTYWVREDAVTRLFQPPAVYVKLVALGLLGPGQIPADVRVQDGDDVLQLTRKTGDDDRKQWHITQPWEEIADQAEADSVIRSFADLRGIKLTTPLDKAQFKLGPDLSTRRVDVRSGEGDQAKITQLFIGERKDGMHTGLLIKPDATEEFWMFRANDLFPVFRSPADFRVLPPFSGKVRHILLTWKGRFPGLDPKDAQRTEEQAWALANELLARAATEDFVELQEEYNEDSSQPTAEYDVDPTAQLVRPFLRLSSQLKVGEVGIVESQFGLHVIKRVE